MACKALSFVYNGQASEDYGLYIGELGGKMEDSSMASTNTELIYDTIPNRIENFIYQVKITEDLLEFNMKLFFENPTDIGKDDLKYIDQWLFSNKYPKKLIICQEDMLNCYYNAIFKDNNILYYGNKPYGYDCTVQCDSPYAYEFEHEHTISIQHGQIGKLRVNNTSSGISYIFPNINFICNKENGSIYIKNINDNGRTLIFENLKQGEEITLDKWFQITSSYGLRRLGNCNKKWLRFVQGINNIEISGDLTKFNIKYQFMQGVGS